MHPLRRRVVAGLLDGVLAFAESMRRDYVQSRVSKLVASHGMLQLGGCMHAGAAQSLTSSRHVRCGATARDQIRMQLMVDRATAALKVIETADDARLDRLHIEHAALLRRHSQLSEQQAKQLANDRYVAMAQLVHDKLAV